MLNEIKALERKIYTTDDWKIKGDLIKDAFKLSANIVKTVVPEQKHYIIDKVVETLLTNRGTGWFCDKQQGLIITTTDKKEIARYAARWVIAAREAGMEI